MHTRQHRALMSLLYTVVRSSSSFLYRSTVFSSSVSSGCRHFFHEEGGRGHKYYITMLRRSFTLKHAPLIHFRYGQRNGQVEPATPTSSTAAPTAGAAAATGVASARVVTILRSLSELPATLRPRPISLEEVEDIRLGGATAYVDGGDAKKKGKK